MFLFVFNPGNNLSSFFKQKKTAKHSDPMIYLSLKNNTKIESMISISAGIKDTFLSMDLIYQGKIFRPSTENYSKKITIIKTLQYYPSATQKSIIAN